LDFRFAILDFVSNSPAKGATSMESEIGNPKPKIERCAGQELNLQSSKAGGLQPLGLANAQPTQVIARVGVEPTGTKV
jgi:hypothetical protein